MTIAAAIFGVSGLSLTDVEKAFLREANPWGFILFARNVETPAQVRALVEEMRATVGREAPVLIDQEGGRVQRLRAPHWREWEPVGSLFALGQNDEDKTLEALQLRYRLIAAELIDLGIDVDCMPLVDVRSKEGHDIIGDRALGDETLAVSRRAKAVIAGLKAGGVLPVIKHLPGHGRAPADSHLALPRVTASLEELDQIDFEAFRPVAEEALGMTAHVIFDAIDSDRCVTESPKAIELIRESIGFDGLLMTDDLSMKALSGPMGQRVTRALRAGCDMVLHCNGDISEMQEIAAHAPALVGAAQRRARTAEACRSSATPFDIDQALERYRELTSEAAYV